MEILLQQPQQLKTHMPEWVVPEGDLKLERRRELQNKALDRFQELGLITRVVNEGEEVLIINNKDFFIYGGGEIRYPSGDIKFVGLNELLEAETKKLMYSRDLGKGKKDRTLFYVFHDKKAILNYEDLSLARDIIYIPDTVDAAFDVEEISKNKDKYIFLFSDLSKSWQGTCPTKDREFDSGISNFDVSTAMMVWGKGEAKRENESLTVIKKVGGDSDERQSISGKWITSNFGVRSVGAGRYWDSPVPLMEKFGDKLSKTGLLTSQDFERPEREIKVLSLGKFKWNGDNYNLGSEYSGMKLESLGGDAFAIIDNDGILKAMFDTTIKKGAESLVKLHQLGSKGRTRRYIPREAINFLGGKEDQINIVQFGGDARQITSVDNQQSLSNLNKLKDICEIHGVDTADLNITELFLVSMSFGEASETGKSDMLGFITRFGTGGLKAIAEGQVQGGVDKLFFKLKESKSPVMEKVFNIYSDALDNTEKLNNVLLERAKDLVSNRDFEAFKLFNLPHLNPRP